MENMVPELHLCFLSLLHSSPGPPLAAADVATTLNKAFLLSHDNCNRKRMTSDNLGIIDTQQAQAQGQTWHITMATVLSF